MVKYQNEINYKITTTLDKTGIAQLQAQLSQIQAKLTSKAGTSFYSVRQAEQDVQRIKTVQKLLTKNYNGTTGLLNLKGFTSGLNDARISIGQLQSSFGNAGVVGQKAFVNMLGQISTFQKGLRQTTSLTEQLSNTLGNTVR